MADHKRQHYVPRCYFKPFSLEGDGVAINLYNISSAKAVQNVSVRGQCAKNYLYSSDLRLESALKKLEDEYAYILRLLQDHSYQPSQDDLFFLRGFAYMQHARTEMAIRRMREQHEGLHTAVFEGKPGTPPDRDLSDRALMLDSMRAYMGTRHLIEDLKVCILRNQTQHDFITSDDPSVFTSRFYVQKLRRRNFGLASSGAQFFLPLTPRLLLICYDSSVYTVPGKIGCWVTITKPSDVIALNELQYLKAAENIYFADWGCGDHVMKMFDAVSARRPESWCEYTVLVPNGFTEQGEHYRRATEEKRRG